jgi:choline dehydrogenase-like flavoprotein
MECDFDVVVIGSGAGGAAFAHACAAAGKRVLVLERGRRPVVDHSAHDEQTTLIEKRWYDDRRVAVNEVPSRLYMGGVVGGSTALFGGAMLRPSVDDFHPGRFYADRLPRALWDWPIGYDDLAPFYDEAESLYQLAAAEGESFGPLETPRNARRDILPTAPINERLLETNRRAGLRPFRLPLAIDARRCERCSSCAGFLCPNGARRSAGQILDEASRQHPLQLMTDVEVDRFKTASGGRIDAAVVRRCTDGTTHRFRGRCYALAAGAIASPAVLLRSRIEGPHIGRNYMMHYSPISVGLFAQPTGADETFVKQIGFADYYYGTKALPRKMGLIQSLPAPGPLMLGKMGLKRWPQGVLRFLRNRMLPLAGIVEDLPDPANRVELKGDGSIGLKHEFNAFDRERGRALGREMNRILRRAGAVMRTSRSFPSREHVAHQCGTLRFGRDPSESVADRDGRVFGHENLFVADGSVMPTSLGVGPSLTITALALRSARAALAGM